MKNEETMFNNPNPNVRLLNDLLAKMSDDPNEERAARLGHLIAQYFGCNIEGFLTCMEIALSRSIANLTRTLAYE